MAISMGEVLWVVALPCLLIHPAECYIQLSFFPLSLKIGFGSYCGFAFVAYRCTIGIPSRNRISQKSLGIFLGQQIFFRLIPLFHLHKIISATATAE